MPATPVDAGMLRPYISALVIQYTGSMLDKALAVLRGRIETSVGRHRGTITVVASGLDGALTVDPPSDADQQDLPTADEIVGFVYSQEVVPAWLKSDSPFVDTRHYSAILVRSGNLIAINAERSVCDSIVRWIRGDPAPPFRLIPKRFLNEALLKGDTRSLSLHGTHRRQRRKADSKNIHGSDLRSALNPFEDSTFTFSSARAEVDEDTHVGLQGVVGATPTRSHVWNRPGESFGYFRLAILEVLSDIAGAMAGAGLDQPFPLLATEVDSLTGVEHAFEVAALGGEEVRALPDTSDELVVAAEVLERAQLDVVTAGPSPDFLLAVGFGATAGHLAVHVTNVGESAAFSFGIQGTPSDPGPVSTIRDALNAHPDLLSVYYASGHTIAFAKITQTTIRPAAFTNWQWWAPGSCDICSEKPPGDGPAMHAAISLPGDNSVFAWVVDHIGPGWLTCDDGPGEAADFVHLAPDETLTLIHVKGANNDSANRQVSASAFEVVVGQATKNVGFLDGNELHARLSSSSNLSRATWKDGLRQPDRTSFLGALLTRSITAKFRVMVVQPHMMLSRYQTLKAPGVAASEDLLRLQRLETLLNSARGAVIGLGGDLVAVGCG
jgi:hypothetical protein